MARFTLSKEERLTSLKEIELLFSEGKSLTFFPLRLVWRPVPHTGQPTVKALFTVSKKKLPGAVDRNRAKRLMREGYRHLKPWLFETLQGATFHLGIVYTANEEPDLETIRHKMEEALKRFLRQALSA